MERDEKLEKEILDPRKRRRKKEERGKRRERTREKRKRKKRNLGSREYEIGSVRVCDRVDFIVSILGST